MVFLSGGWREGGVLCWVSFLTPMLVGGGKKQPRRFMRGCLERYF